ncbi:hypothetical protein J5N97_027423 [Dioscorea zingiberensis]|uniref:Uncharacterized protein n=1 Tax=Dioscorea zingiberensis TaxID=325984 RepID=A0A9D5H7P0_9LILI|nr:hypothetical protein J5N97_027423 [Dioscorea zingiberensis]
MKPKARAVREAKAAAAGTETEAAEVGLGAGESAARDISTREEAMTMAMRAESLSLRDGEAMDATSHIWFKSSNRSSLWTELGDSSEEALTWRAENLLASERLEAEKAMGRR